jgi:hypothetical protein
MSLFLVFMFVELIFLDSYPVKKKKKNQSNHPTCLTDYYSLSRLFVM